MHFNDGLWAFLPKGEQEDDGSTGPGFVERLPSETRPLTTKDTDNELIAAAVTYASLPTFKDSVNSILRCLNVRNVANPECMFPPPPSVANIACSVLFDFAAAFPSVLQAWLLSVLQAIQAPVGFINT